MIIENLPSDLKENVLGRVYAQVFAKIRFFEDKDQKFNLEVAHHLSMLSFYKGEILYEQNEVVDYIYFIH